jgi:hypothetical protein
LREHLRKCGRIGDGSHAALTDKDRGKLRDSLNTYEKLGKLASMVNTSGSRESAILTHPHAKSHATKAARLRENVRESLGLSRFSRGG